MSRLVCAHVRQEWRGQRLPCADVECPETVHGLVFCMEIMETADAGVRGEFGRRRVAGQWTWGPPSETLIDFSKARADVHARTMQFIARNV